MPTLWQHVRGKFDRSKNSKWGWRVSAVYGMCVWTLLGVVVVKLISSSTMLVASQYGMSKDTYTALSEEEKEGMAQEAKLKTWASKLKFCFQFTLFTILLPHFPQPLFPNITMYSSFTVMELHGGHFLCLGIQRSLKDFLIEIPCTK